MAWSGVCYMFWKKFYSHVHNMLHLHRTCFTSRRYAMNSITLLKRALVYREISPSIMPVDLLQHVPGTFAGDAVVSRH